MSKLRYLMFQYNYVFDNVRITLYLGTFELRMETTLQLCFVFARPCDAFFIMTQSRYLFVRHSYAF